MFKKITLAVPATALLLLSGCAMNRQDPFAEIQSAQGARQSPGRDLTAVLALSKNTIEAMDYMGRYRGVGSSEQGRRLFSGLANVVQSGFKSVVKADSIEQAKGIDADVVVVLDVFANVGVSDSHAEVSAIILGRDGRQIDVVKAQHAESAFAHFTGAGMMEGLTDGTIAEFQKAFFSSTKLAEFARSKAPPAVAAAPAAAPAPVAEAFSSDVDAPKSRRAEDPTRFAVIVGIEKYLNDLPDAQFATRDAEAVRANLVAQGYPERNIKMLSGTQATKGQLEAYLQDWLPRVVGQDSQVFFYFSGHGAPDPASNQAYLVPVDGSPNFLDKTAYPLKRLYSDLGALKAKRVIVALDSCFSGAGGRSVLAQGTRPLVTKVDTSLSSPGKLVLFAATSPSEVTSTLPEQRHGIFTYYLLKGMERGGTLTARELFDYLKPKVQDEASRQNRDQTPLFEGAADVEL